MFTEQGWFLDGLFGILVSGQHSLFSPYTISQLGHTSKSCVLLFVKQKKTAYNIDMLTFMIFFMIFSLCTTTIKLNSQTHPYCTSPKNNSSSGNTLFTIGLNLIEITNNYHYKRITLTLPLPLVLLPLSIVGLSLTGFLSITTSKIDESYTHSQIVQ